MEIQSLINTTENLNLNEFNFDETKKLDLNFINNFKDDEEIGDSKLQLELDPVKLSLITSEGFISNIQYVEQEFIKTVKLSKRIIKIQSNYGHVLVNPEFAHLVKVEETKPKRGRRPLDKKKSVRKKQGAERGFHSQIEFFYYNPDINNKCFRIKLFVNGRIQIPGVKDEKFKDVEKIIKYFVSYINKFNEIKIDKTLKCEFKYITSVMENYRSYINILNPSLKGKKVKLDFEILKHLFESYRNVLKSKYEILVINHSYESPRFIIKFHTPITGHKKELFDEFKPGFDKKKKVKKTTLILFASGKLNINGGNNRIESTEIINYMYNIINLHANEVYYVNI